MDRTNGAGGDPPQREEGDIPETDDQTGNENGHEDEDPGVPDE
ncbi:hypothetical protein [Streptomyces chrestomyceticus]|nr:hypothetical protein [Streptomyces chrestomyceticus]